MGDLGDDYFCVNMNSGHIRILLFDVFHGLHAHFYKVILCNIFSSSCKNAYPYININRMTTWDINQPRTLVAWLPMFFWELRLPYFHGEKFSLKFLLLYVPTLKNPDSNNNTYSHISILFSKCLMLFASSYTNQSTDIGVIL